MQDSINPENQQQAVSLWFLISENVGYISTVIASVLLVWTSLSEKYRGIIKRKLSLTQEVAGLKKSIKVDDAEGNTAELDFLIKLKQEFSQSAVNDIEKDKALSLLRLKVDRMSERLYRAEMAFDRLILMCEQMCNKKEICKQTIESIKAEFKLNYEENNDD